MKVTRFRGRAKTLRACWGSLTGVLEMVHKVRSVAEGCSDRMSARDFFFFLVLQLELHTVQQALH